MAKAATKEKTGIKEKPKVDVHPHLFELFKKEKEATEKAASYTIEIAELVQKENLSNAVVILTMMKARGITQASAASQNSRIRNLIKRPDQLEALKSGEATVRAVSKASTSRENIASPKSRKKAFDQALSKFVEAAKAYGQDRKTIMVTVEACLDEAKIK